MPALIHVQELTQPQGHSTSGSHERYKTPSRLTWEKEHDCIKKMEEWMLLNGIASEEEIAAIKIQAVEYAKSSKDTAWNNYSSDLKQQHDIYSEIWKSIPENLKTESIKTLRNEIKNVSYPAYSDLVANGRKLQFQLTRFGHYRNESLDNFVSKGRTIGAERYNTHLYSDTKYSALEVAQILPKFGIEPKLVNGFKILNSYFDQLLEFKPNIVAFGEDVGHIGDVNQGFAGLQTNMEMKECLIPVSESGPSWVRQWNVLCVGYGPLLKFSMWIIWHMLFQF